MEITAQVIVENLIDNFKSEISLFPGLKKNAQKLSDSLDTVQLLLNDAERRRIPSGTLKSWLENLEDDADDVLDEVNYHHLSNQIKTLQHTKVLTRCFSFLNHYSNQRRMAVRIKRILEKLEDITNLAARLGLVQRLGCAPTLSRASPETFSFEIDPVFVGRDEELVKLVGKVSNNTQERVFSILAIQGMGGIGKTSLTRRIFHHERVKTRFGKSRIWLHVSQHFDRFVLLKQFIGIITGLYVEDETREEIIPEMIREALKDKTYLLVLDDVWNEDPNTWEYFINSLSEVTSTKGNAIIITTRNQNVASMVKPLHIHPMEGLSNGECWSIIKATTSGKIDGSSEYGNTGGDIVRKCSGLLFATNTKEEEERVFSTLAIVGKDGTSLARKIFKHERTETHFGQSRIWLNVSQSFDAVILLKKVLEMLTYSSVGDESREVIMEKLREALEGKTYLLVLDDLWNEEENKWEDFMSSLSGVTTTKGNGIMITTSSDKVASVVKPLHIHQMEDLSAEELFSIIKMTDFGDEDSPSESEATEGKIARKCCGLPLAAKVVGQVMRNSSIEKSIFIEQNWLLKDEGQIISDTLRLSFDNLSLPLEKCFAYCSIFPKGHQIWKQPIIEMWMAEGFLQPDQGNGDMESLGNYFFNILLHNSLLLVTTRDYHGNVESCVMHDLVHELVSSVLGSSYYLLDDRESYGNQVRYLIRGADDDSSDPIREETKKYLRTLIFQGEITDDTMFLGFNSLHVLILDSDQVTTLPTSVSKLRHLRNLNISRTRIVYLPIWIGELHYLQTLNACTEYLKELPSTFKYLVSLRHLYIPSHVKLPQEIGTFTNLRALKFRVGEEKGYRIEELGSLGNLIELHIDDLEKVRDKEEAEKANISKKQNLTALLLQWDEYGEGETKDESVLEGLQPQSNLEKLVIKGFRGKRFPSWTLKMAVKNEPGGTWVGLSKLMNLTLSRCQGCEEIPMLGHLPNLKSLHLWSLCNVKLINRSFYGIDSCSNGVIFPALESMLVSDMPELRRWAEGEFPYLETKVFPRLQSLKVYHCKNLESLPAWLFYKAHNLIEMEIRHCSKLKQLPDGLRTLHSLESMTIKGCQNLKSLAYPSGGGEPQGSLTSLRSLEIRDCQELKVVVGSQAHLLKKVCLVELERLENLPTFIDCLAESPFLEELTILGIPNFMSTSSVEIWPFPKLRKLEMGVGMEGSSETSEAITKMVNGVLKGCCFSLGELTLRGLDIWESLPEGIQGLSSLSSLELENFGVVELPLWIGDVSLTRLCLSNCTKLRHLPPMQHLTNLKELHIRDCPELRIESERHKVAHGSFIYINGHRI